MIVDGLTTQGARASTARILPYFFRNIPVTTLYRSVELCVVSHLGRFRLNTQCTIRCPLGQWNTNVSWSWYISHPISGCAFYNFLCIALTSSRAVLLILPTSPRWSPGTLRHCHINRHISVCCHYLSLSLRMQSHVTKYLGHKAAAISLKCVTSNTIEQKHWQ